MDETQDSPPKVARATIDRRIAGVYAFATLLAVALVVLIGTVAIIKEHDEEVSAAEQRTAGLSQQLSVSLAGMLDRVDRGLLAIRAEIVRQEQSGSADPTLLRAVMRGLDAVVDDTGGFRVYDNKGVLAQAVTNASAATMAVNDRSFFTEARDNLSDQMIVNGPQVGAASGRPTIILARAVRRADGSFAGVVAAAIAVTKFTELLSTIDIGPHGTAAIFDKQRAMIARIPATVEPGELNPGTLTSESIRTAIDARGAGTTFRYVSPFDGTSRLGSIRPVGTHPFLVRVGLSDRDYLTAWRVETTIIVTFCVVLIVALVLLGIYLCRREVAYRRSINRVSASSQRYQTLFERTPLPKWVVDPSNMRVIEVNEAAIQRYGYTREEFLKLTVSDIRTPEADRNSRDVIEVAKQGLYRGETQHRTKDGRSIEVEFFSIPIEIDGRPALVASLNDITDRKLADRNRALAHQVFVHAREAILITDDRQRIIDVNPAFVELTGYERDEAMGRTPRLFKAGVQDDALYRQMWGDLVAKGFWRGEMWDRRKNGEIYAQIATVAEVKNQDGLTEQYVCVLSDITSLKQQESELRNQAFLDPLTKLPNRLLLVDRLRRALIRSKRHQGLLAVCFIDLDGFKPVNDSMGHEVGDRVLTVVAQRIQSSLREEDTVARIGGDEFVVLMTDIKRWEECEIPVERIAQAIRAPIEVGNTRISVSASIGIAIAPEDGDGDDLLLRRADMAMYVAKQQGRDRHVYYRADMTVTAPQAAEGSKR